MGIGYLDVNGLKDINDKYGHEFGDKVLIECARRMKVVFKDANFYRIGGDEFVIICPGIDQEAFQALLRELKAQFRKDTNYQAAIGAQWMESIDNIGHIIAAADAHMYEDKRAFYHRHPESNSPAGGRAGAEKRVRKGPFRRLSAAEDIVCKL